MINLRLKKSINLALLNPSNMNVLSITGISIIFDTSKMVIIGFLKLYGLSWKLLITFFYKCGVLYTIAYKKLTSEHASYFYSLLTKYGSNKNIQIDSGNKQLRSYLLFSNYKGYRLQNGLPARGQRTRSNAKSVRSLLYHKRVVSILKNLAKI